MALDSDEAASALWLQLILMVIGTILIYILWWLYRRYMFMSCYLIILVDICLLPFAFGDHSAFFTSKWLILCPILLVLTLWRISYYRPPQKDEEISLFYKILLIPSEYIFRTKNIDNKQDYPPSKIMQWIIFLVYFSNILIAVLTSSIAAGNVTNSICGIVLALTLPLPSKILYNQHGYLVQTDTNDADLYHYLDVVALGQSAEWIISYTSWDMCFLWDYAPKSIFWFPLHLGPCLVISLLNKSYHLYMISRLFCLAIVFLIQTPSAKNEGILPWIFDGTQFEDVVTVSNESYVFEIWGAINLIIAGVHAYKWMKWIKGKRFETIESDVNDAIEVTTIPKTTNND